MRGQTADFQADSTVVVTGQSVPTGSVTSVNSWKNGARVIFACKSVDLDGQEVTIPHYISAPRVKGDTSVLTPVTSFSVLVVSNTKTKTMIDVTKGVTGRFEFTQGQTKCEVSYDTFSGGVNDQWKAESDAIKLN